MLVRKTFCIQNQHCFSLKRKTRRVMGDNIALHAYLPLNELPVKMRGRIPKKEIWVREDYYDDDEKLRGIRLHEKKELYLMVVHGLTYKNAHRKASESNPCN